MDKPSAARIAYFSMEIALEPGMPTYSGGLGVLAGDTIRSAADMKVPMVAVSLLHRKGYFYQRLESDGSQREEPEQWSVDEYLHELPERVTVMAEGRPVHVRAWKYEVEGFGGFRVPVYLLDTNLAENSDWDRSLTGQLYGGDNWYRLCQEAILGVGGVRMLRALGYSEIQRFHMNEGHAALLTIELLFEEARRAKRNKINRHDIESVRRKCIFTTHTPVPAGHDHFPMEMVSKFLREPEIFLDMKDVGCVNLAGQVLRQSGIESTDDVFRGGNTLNMTYLALNLSQYVNGVAKKHAEVSRHMFAEYQVDAVTNGVHCATWTSAPFRALFDRYIPGWREDNFALRYALSIPPQEVWEAHYTAKRDLIRHVNHETNAGMDVDVFTLGFARRAAAYKRGDLLFRDLERLRSIATKTGRFQVVFAGKAHPKDESGKELIKRVFMAREALRPKVTIAYLQNYDIALAEHLTAGVDVWLNTPQPPLEASGTSGMKAALNGVPSLSVLDGWWIEGCIENATGWAIGERCDTAGAVEERSACDAESLYDKLENIVIPMFYRDRDIFLEVMRHAIALNGSFFNTQRMMLQYVSRAYFH